MKIVEELLKELQESMDKVNKIILDDELTTHTKTFLMGEEFKKQDNLKQLREQWIKI